MLLKIFTGLFGVSEVFLDNKMLMTKNFPKTVSLAFKEWLEGNSISIFLKSQNCYKLFKGTPNY